MRKIISLFLACVLIFALAACGNKTPEQNTVRDAVEVELINTHFNTYDYQRERIVLDIPESFIYAALAYGNRFYYITVESDSQDKPVIVVTSLNMDGSDTKRIEMQSPGDEVSSFSITEDGNFAFIVFNRTVTLQGINLSVFYIEYDRSGTELTRRELRDFALVDFPQLNTFAILNDGRVLAIDPNENELCEIDFISRDRGDSYLFAEESGRVRGIFSTEKSSPFDILVSDDFYLYGYCFETNEQTVLLRWVQSGFSNVNFAQACIFDDGHIIILIPNRNATGEVMTELYFLTPFRRTVTLTLKALSVPDDVRRAVALFNRQNPPYRIEIYEYFDQKNIPAGTNIDIWREILNQAMMRLQEDLMAGNLPDIFYMPTEEMIDRGFLLDLNPLIDADPDINRDDFFQNVFIEMLRPDGTLFGISNKFYINTIVSRNEILGHIDTWTLAELISLIHSTQDMTLPFGRFMTRENLLGLVSLYGLGFFDFDNFQASFDSDEFINLLNAAKLLPSFSDLPHDTGIYGSFTEVLQMQTGDQILSYVNFHSPSGYQLFAESLTDFLALGIPTAAGGKHMITHYGTIGIGANTNHVDAAWAFLRSFLLPSAAEFEPEGGSFGFPLRIDLFNELVKNTITTIPYVPGEGEIAESPHETYSLFDGLEVIVLLSMSEETANGLRTLIESAVHPGRGMSEELWAIIEGDLADFYAGARSAEETARIIQNRVERWMSEQHLLAGG